MTVPRREAVEIAYYLAQHGARGTAINRAVAEGRDSGRYSSCGDLLHCVAFACGMRDETINRDEYRGWRSGVNISRWFRWWRTPSLAAMMPGDFLLYDGTEPNAHVCVLISRGVTADFGQPGGRVRECPITGTDARPRFRGRRVTGVISLASLPWSEEALTVGPWLEAHGLDTADWFANGLTADQLCTADELLRIDREGA